MEEDEGVTYFEAIVQYVSGETAEDNPQASKASWSTF
jgi:hypothetical protein